MTAFRGDLEADARRLARLVEAGERTLAELPSRSSRDSGQRQAAAKVHATARAAREAFLATHVSAVYDALTDRRHSTPRLPELIAAAAERFPGLVPTRAQLAEERRHLQADKEGREIDQGVFCGAVLRDPGCGRHLIDAMLRPTDRSLALLDDFRATDRCELDVVTVERIGHAAHVTFRNTHCLNSEDLRLIADMETAVDLALLDDRVRVGVLRGGRVDHPKYRGRRVFSAGINLKELRAGAIPFVEFLMGRELGYINKMLRGQKPWIGAVDTFAIGGGMQLLLVLDRVILARDAFVSLPAAEEGIVPGLGNLRLTRAVGARLARQIILGGRRISAEEPEARLLCDEVVEEEEMEAAIGRAVEQLAASAVPANRHMLAVAEEPVDLFRGYLAEFATAQSTRAYGEDVLAKLDRRWA